MDIQSKIDLLWEIRNVDFYGNVKIGKEKREIYHDEVEDGLKSVKRIIDEIEKIIIDR